jgi:hemerythrin-like domain-containing protein
LVARVQKGDLVAREDVDALLLFLGEFAHDYHDAKEQAILLPALAACGVCVENGPFRKMREDHDQIGDDITALRQAVDQRNDTDFVELAERYINTVTTHIFNEDRFLFRSISRQLANEENGPIIRHFESLAPELSQKRLNLYRRTIQELEEKYFNAQ